MSRVFYLGKRTRWLLGGMDGKALRFFILIDDRKRNKSSLLHHEMVHIEQMKRIGTIKYAWRYFVQHWCGDSTFRAEVETEAYMVGSKFSGPKTAYMLKTYYGISKFLDEEAVVKFIKTEGGEE